MPSMLISSCVARPGMTSGSGGRPCRTRGYWLRLTACGDGQVNALTSHLKQKLYEFAGHAWPPTVFQIELFQGRRYRTMLR